MLKTLAPLKFNEFPPALSCLKNARIFSDPYKL